MPSMKEVGKNGTVFMRSEGRFTNIGPGSVPYLLSMKKDVEAIARVINSGLSCSSGLSLSGISSPQIGDNGFREFGSEVFMYGPQPEFFTIVWRYVGFHTERFDSREVGSNLPSVSAIRLK